MAYTIRVVLLLVCLCGLLVACGEPTGGDRVGATGTGIPPEITSAIAPITIRGIVQRREATSYQYGTHTLLDTSGRTLYALTADDGGLLDRHLGEEVLVTGALRAGYPLDGGPALLVVSSIRRDLP